MKRPFSNVRSARRQSGLSLVLVLFGVLCLSFLIVVFFSLASNDRSSTAAYINSMRVEEIGTGGLELVLKELRKEIVDPVRSTAHLDPLLKGPAIYLPTDRDYMVPEKNTTDPIGNLVKVSDSNAPLFSGTGATLRASVASSSTASRNGRSISIERWNKPALGLFGGAVRTPDWIYIDRQGPIATPILADASDAAKPGFVLGRIAFAVYDISGLLNVNVAGHPSNLPDADAVKKGSPALVKLQGIGLNDAQVQSIVGFRNAKSSATAENYKDYLTDKKHAGFTKTLSGDNRFLSRQELIRFAKRNGFEDKLNFLSVFTREKNAPSYQPPPAVESSTNPNFATLRHAGTGRLLFEQRFPLSRLQLISNLINEPSNQENVENVAKYFGLTYIAASRSFTYKASSIKTPDQIAAEADYREPDFFEVLKAGIQQGSIGQSAGQTATVSDDPSKDAHIMQIGANIIDQYDLDADRDGAGIPIPIPTTIQFAGNPLYGVESLPYVNKISILGELFAGGTFNGQPNNMAVGNARSHANVDSYAFMAAAELWNPHFQKMPTSTTPSQTIYNPQIRISMRGDTQITMYASEDASDPPSGSPAVGLATPNKGFGSNTISSSVTYGSNESRWGADYQNYFFIEPRLIRVDKAVPGQMSYNKLTEQAGNPEFTRFAFSSAKVNLNQPLSVELSVLDKDGVPRVYQKTLDTAIPALEISKTASPNESSARLNRSTSLAHSDPRTNRLGYFGINYSPYRSLPSPATTSENPIGSFPVVDGTSFAANATYQFSLRPRFDKFISNDDSRGIATTHGVPASTYSPRSTGLYLGMLWENTDAVTRIQDPDGTYRQGDGGFSAESAALNPMEPIARFRNPSIAYPNSAGVRQPGTNASRPVILDRPFQSIADLGYVYRDIPWRSLNFSSADSADASLLDVFSIEDSAVIEGRVNLNSARADVIKSLLLDSVKEERTITSKLSDGQASAAASRLLGFLSSSSGPIQNISELVTEFSTPTNLTNSELGQSSTGESSFAIKTQREAIIRALAGTTQTRTWNFLIDLVAQTGRFPNGARSLDDFMVEGERRYWLHVAIDRYTGEIVSELLETVNE